MGNKKKALVRGIAAAGAIGLAAGLAACSGGGGEGGGQVVVANYGGITLEGFEAAYFDDFTAETGIEVISADADVARYVQMSESGESEWDSIDADGFANVDWINRGLVQEMSADVPRASLVPDEYKDYIAGAYTQSFVLAYRASALDREPTSWKDFWDVEGLPGNRGWPGYYIGTAEAALLADGVAADELFPLDFDRAFGKLDEIKSDLTFFESYAAGAQALQAGTVDMILLPNGRVTPLMAEDDDVKIMWDENLFYPFTGFTISQGAPNPEAMNKLMVYMQDPARQAEFAEITGYGPTVDGALELLSPETAAILPGTEEHMRNAVTIDQVTLSSQTDEYVRRYSEWLAG